MVLKVSFQRLLDAGMQLKQDEWFLPENMRSDAASKEISSAWEEGQAASSTALAAPTSRQKDEEGQAASSTAVPATSSPQNDVGAEAQLALPAPPQHDAEAETSLQEQTPQMRKRMIKKARKRRRKKMIKL